MLSIDEVLTRGVEQVLPSKESLAKLLTQKKITLYQGFDPSASSLHLGNYVGLLKLSQFQKLGHKVIFVVGDFTGSIGDPDKNTSRPELSRQKTRENSRLFKQQASRILSFSGPNAAEMRFNSEWNDKLSMTQFLQIARKFTIGQLIERDMFQKRLKDNAQIYLHEFLYPVFQGYDSVFLNVDLEIGGNDQLFNILAGRNLMKSTKNREKYVLTTKLLTDSKGDKVGKTTGNALFLNSTPEDFYGGIMAFSDDVIALGFEILTEVDLSGLSEKIEVNPMKEKKRLAFEVVKIIWSEKDALTAADTFENNFQKREVPKNISIIRTSERSLPLLDLVFLTKTTPSRSETKRLISQNAVELNGKIHNNPTEEIAIPKSGLNIKIGKKIFIKIKCS